MKHLGDITKTSGYEVPVVDCVIGGSPCQDLSVAGKRAGLKHEANGDEETTRSGLFMEAVRIIREMREATNGAYPRFALWENVPGAFSSNKGEDFRAVLEETARVAEKDAVIPRPENGKWSHSGCIMGDGWSIAWRVHDAQFWGVPQRRKRIALVADFGGASAPEILFERIGLSGNTEKSREERENTSGTSEGNTYETISFLERAGCDGGVRESLSNTNEQQHCQHSTTNTYCIGNGQVHDAMTPSPVCKTLNTMDDPMKIMTVSQDAYDKFSENDKYASLKASGGTYGGGSEALVIQ